MFGIKTNSLFGETKKLEREIDEFVDILSEVGLVFKNIIPIYLTNGSSEQFDEMVEKSQRNGKEKLIKLQKK